MPESSYSPPDKVQLHKQSRVLELQYGASTYELSCEFLRVHSPFCRGQRPRPGPGGTAVRQKKCRNHQSGDCGKLRFEDYFRLTAMTRVSTPGSTCLSCVKIKIRCGRSISRPYTRPTRAATPAFRLCSSWTPVKTTELIAIIRCPLWSF